jgi:hypothetical protein
MHTALSPHGDKSSPRGRWGIYALALPEVLTISQANHCFYISAHPKTQNSKTGSSNKEVTIIPEMENAVVCPETGKSLKHQELIIKLRYIIKWMRSTANEINRPYNTNTLRFIRRSNIPKGQK